MVQVRGTPASGKTSLCRLLYHELVRRCEDIKTEIYTLSEWPKDDPKVDSFRRAIPTWFSGPTRYILFDEGQDSYWDRPLWNDYFKTMSAGTTSIRLILFCSYGSPSNRLNDIPGLGSLVLSPDARISLRPRSTGDLGLLLTRPEYDDVLIKYPKQVLFTEDMKDAIYEWTAGHVGAIVSILEFILRRHTHEIHAGKYYSLDDYYSNYPAFSSLLESFINSVAGRGVPRSRDIQTNVQVIRRILKDFVVDIPAGQDEEALKSCHFQGWIQSDLLEDDRTTWYTFPSPLHSSCISWLLQILPSPVPLPFNSVYELTLEAIKLFRPYDTRRKEGGSSNEAQYQLEFYRGLLESCPRTVVVSPEFASASRTHRAGRIDFFIPEKKWGFECIR
ncbi:hypothetical protein FRB95_006319, partial [Tulasnella sp. JGI-2019a]